VVDLKGYMGASIVAIIIFFGLDQANLLKFNQKHPNNRHFESLNRCFQEGEKFIEDVIGSDQRGFVGGYPRSHIGVSGSILLALSFRVKKVKKYVAYYLPVAARILFLIP